MGLGPLGGLILGLFAARLIRRHGSRTIALWPQILSTTCLLLLARAPHTAWVFVAMIVMNVFDALTDIAMDNVNSTPGLAAGSGLTVATWIMRLGFHDPPRAHRPAGRHRLAALGAGLPAGRGSADPDGHPGVPASHSGAPGPTHPQRR